jgi:hypothetical protein
MPPRRPLLVLLLLPVLVGLAGCGGKTSAADVERAQRELDPQTFADIQCTADHESGWNYVCSYSDPRLGPRKLGVIVGRSRTMMGSGSVPVSARLPDAPGHHAETRSAWVVLANRGCAKRAAAVRKLPTPRTQNELIDAGARIVSLEDVEYSQLAGIHPTAEDQAEVSAFLASIRRIQRDIDRFRNALMLRDAARLLEAKAALAAARRDSNARARRLGLTCRH